MPRPPGPIRQARARHPEVEATEGLRDSHRIHRGGGDGGCHGPPTPARLGGRRSKRRRGSIRRGSGPVSGEGGDRRGCVSTRQVQSGCVSPRHAQSGSHCSRHGGDGRVPGAGGGRPDIVRSCAASAILRARASAAWRSRSQARAAARMRAWPSAAAPRPAVRTVARAEFGGGGGGKAAAAMAFSAAWT